MNTPISPHLQIYRWQITSVFSIAHRFSGIFLYGMTWVWLFILYCDASATCFQTMWGIFILAFYILALYYHLFNGIRHMCWDMCWGFNLAHVQYSAYGVLGAASLSTLLTLWWIYVAL